MVDQNARATHSVIGATARPQVCVVSESRVANGGHQTAVAIALLKEPFTPYPQDEQMNKVFADDEASERTANAFQEPCGGEDYPIV